MVNKYNTGTTIKFLATYYNWKGDLIDPESLTFSIYDNRFLPVSTFPVTTANRLSLGQYYYLWIPETTGTFIYEWKGIINEKPSLRRDSIMIVNV